MPINFELTFTQPLLKDLSNAKFQNVQEYAEGIAKYYVQTVSQGAPLAIPPTLPAPSLSGAPGPVGTGPADAYGKPNIDASKLKFETTIDTFYTLREVLLSKESVEAKRLALENVVRKAEFDLKQLGAKIKLIGELKRKIEAAPADIKNTIEAVKLLFEEFIKQVKNVREDIVSQDVKGNLDDIDIEAEFKKKFPDEAAILDSLLNINFGDIQGTIRTIQKAQEYFNRINANTQKSVSQFAQFDSNQQKEYAKRKITQSVTKIFTLSTALIAPESLGALIISTRKKGQSFSEDANRTLDKAIAASERLGALKVFVEPELRKLEDFVERKKKQIKQELKKRSKVLEDKIKAKGEEIIQKQSKIKKPGLSDKVKGFQARAEKAKADAERFKALAEKYVALAKSATKLVTKATGIVTAADALKDEIFEAADSIEGQIEQLSQQTKQTFESAKNTKSTNLEQEIKSFLTSYNADILNQTPLVKTLSSANVNFIDIKKLLLKTDKKYVTILDKINGLSQDIEEVVSEFEALRQDIPTKKKKPPREVKIKRIKTKPKQNLMSVLKALEEKVYPQARAVANKVQEWVDKKIAEGKAKVDKIKEEIEITLINSLPIPSEKESAQTKKEAAEEKKQIIKEYKVKVEQTTKKSTALASLTSNAVTLTNNITKGDISHASNEKLLKKIADNKFTFFTVGKSGGSAEYRKQEVERDIFLSYVDKFREVDTYISVVKNIAEDVGSFAELKERVTDQANNQKDSFIEQLKSDLDEIIESAQKSASNFEEAGVLGVSPITKSLFDSFEKLFAKDQKPADIVKELKNLIIISQEGVLGETLQAQPVVRVLQGLEKKYLLKTKKTLAALVGSIPQQEEDNEIEDIAANSTTPLTTLDSEIQDARRAVEAKKKAAAEKIGNSKLYKSLLKMHQALSEGRGSVISIAIAKLVELLKEIEVFIKKQIDQVIEVAKKKVKDLIKKNADQQEERLKANLRRTDFIDLLATSITYNIASLLFWAGATWQNSVGTTFVVFSAAPMTPLKVNGRTDGYAAAIRELGTNLEAQLATVTGLCTPNPSLGIPPFPFTGIK